MAVETTVSATSDTNGCNLSSSDEGGSDLHRPATGGSDESGSELSGTYRGSRDEGVSDQRHKRLQPKQQR